MTTFSPIAVVGRACVLPGALSPEALWDAVVEGRDLLSSAPSDRWGLDPASVRTPPESPKADHTWSDRGGYVRGFDGVWDPTGFSLPPEALARLDPLFKWTLHAGREALRDAGVDLAAKGPRTTVVMGNLSFPTGEFNRLAEVAWLAGALGAKHLQDAGVDVPDPRNRFMSGLPALLLAEALGLEGGATSLDAACASALYAIKLACDRLQDRRADVALAGAVNRADDLFIHVGFCALQAMSKTGRSRPFHADADGLVPAEGAAFVVLKRLEDALDDGDTIHGVIRGVGLSNDGRGRSLLAPLVAGQERALHAAWGQAGIEPGELGLLECHATGTPVGDATELQSTARAFGDRPVPIGSLKSNMGHLVTVAGVAGLLKVLGALAHKTRPPTLHLDRPNPVLEDLPFRPVRSPEPWSGPLRAAVSAFGFGGNNAHLVVEALEETPTALRSGLAPIAPVPVAVVGLGAHVGEAGDAGRFADVARGIAEVGAMATSVPVELPGLKFPPADLQHTLPQQALILSVARRVTQDRSPADPARTGVVIGMGCDPEISRYGARWRLSTWAKRLGLPAAWAEAGKDAFVGPLPAAGVVGTMPNIPANRINRQLDAGAFGFTVSAEELSGTMALDIGMRALASGTVDAVVVGAVDLSCEPVHVAALAALGDRRPPGDAAVVLVLKRADDAARDGDPVLATLPSLPDVRTAGAPLPSPDAPLAAPLASSVGHAHAAAGLVEVAAAVVSADSTVTVATAGMAGSAASVVVVPGPAAVQPEPPLRVPVRTVDAHLPSPSLPAVPASVPRATPVGALMPAEDHMVPAPALPSAAVSAQVDVTRGTTQVQSVAAVPAAAPVAFASSPSVPTTLAGSLAQAHGVWMQQLSQAHQSHLQAQVHLHEQFVALRQRAAQALLGSSVVSAASAPWAPAAAEPTPVAATRPAPVATPHAPPPQLRLDQAPPPTSAPSATAGPTAPSDTPAPNAIHRPPPAAQEPIGPPPPQGLTFSKEDLLVHASGDISEIFGPEFKPQDAFAVVTRMPEPPLLLCDRVTGLVAERNTLGRGSIWTETDITDDAWYLNGGRMPAGLMIESGQADLMLISYMGINLLAGPDRLYRLLGCKLTYHGDLPKPGETLRYDIHVDGHAKQGDVRLFFFHYDCYVGDELRLSVRGGQAGFFTQAELDASDGILWTPEDQELVEPPRLDPPALDAGRTSFDEAAVAAFADGRPWEAFGPAWDATKTHHETPRIQSGRHLFFHRITELSPRGGPWGRGYLRAEREIDPSDWFFEGHFKNDPCMPGTLMFEGCLQAVAFYMAALGFTVDKDGWRFQPVQGEAFDMRCRGQTAPDAKLLVYEIFIEEVIAGPIPTIYADLLCTTDGLKGFHARRIGLQLVPDWPLSRRPAIDAAARARTRGDEATHDGFSFDYHSLLACAWGQPSQAFGPLYSRFDSHRRVPRLPGPPYHFMSRVVEVGQPMGTLGQGHRVVVDYDIPDEAWYFEENNAGVMPFCVLLEAALQPCGWLASYAGCTLVGDDDVLFRNLDGTGTLHRELRPGDGTLRTEATLDRISRTGGMTIVAFTVHCTLDGDPVYELQTVFGFFPPESMANQVGLTIDDADRELLERAPNTDTAFAKLAAGRLALPPVPRLQVLERITGLWPEGGPAGLGEIRGEMAVDAAAWFFKAHFYSDPVQPGSLGVEAMLRLLQAFCIETGVGSDLDNPVFESILTTEPHSWTYRGQVVPHNERVVVTAQITSTGADDGGAWVKAKVSYWVDGKRIYGCPELGMRVRPASPDDDSERAPSGADTVVLDPETQPWLADHCPTHTVPAVALMHLADLLASGVTEPVVGLRDLSVKRWVVVNGRTVLTRKTEAMVPGRTRVSLLEDGELVASAVVLTGDAPEPPAPLPALESPVLEADPYASGALFHGPAWQALTRLSMGEGGSSAVLTAEPSDLPVGTLHPRLLDAATHGIPHDQLHRWSDRLGNDVVAYPVFVPRLDLFGPPPTTGTVRCEARLVGELGAGMPRFALQLSTDAGIWADLELVEATFPKGPIGAADSAARRAFLRDHTHGTGVALSAARGTNTVLANADLEASDWLPGTLEATYGTADPEVLAFKEHLARKTGVHPRHLPQALPLTSQSVQVQTAEDGTVTVTSRSEPTLDLTRIEEFWTGWFDRDPWPVEDLYYGLIQRFVGKVVLQDPTAFEALRGKSVLFLGNHQTGIESLLFSILAGGLLEVPCVTIAKDEHRHTWLGDLIRHCFSYPDTRDPRLITYFDRNDKASLMGIIGELAQEMVSPGRSVMVHVEGTRAHTCRKPVEKMSGAFIDMALSVGVPIVPVRFTGGLPVVPLSEKTEFPVGYGTQDIWFGAPLLPADLGSVPYGVRKQRVVDAINALGVDNAAEVPHSGDPTLAARVDALVAETGVGPNDAVLRALVEDRGPGSAEMRRVLAVGEDGVFERTGSASDAWLEALAQQLYGSGLTNVEG